MQLEANESLCSYPGARVDTTAPTYQLMAKETWHTWEWKHLFPGRDELVDYFRHVARVWNLDKDISYNSQVTALHWDAGASRWKYEINKGENSGTVSLLTSRILLDTYGTYSLHPPGMVRGNLHRLRCEEIHVSSTVDPN